MINRNSVWIPSAATLVAVAIVVLLHLFTLRATAPRLTYPEPPGYYGLLTEAFVLGQLHLTVKPDPRLLQLADPYAGAQGVPRLHDATLYDGKYYLYFGPAPVLVLLGPWRLLTGTYLADAAATLVFALAGYLLAARLWCRWRTRFFPGLSNVAHAGALVLIGVGNFVLVLSQSVVFYAVPIVCAYACWLASLTAIDLALERTSSAGRARAMAFASLAAGMAVAARPNYLVCLPLLLLPAILLALQTHCARGGRWAGWRILFWTVVPAGVVGAALVWYNVMRFGSPLEFGVTYQLAGGSQRDLQVFGLRYLRDTFNAYTMSGIYYTRYFPFVALQSPVAGFVPWAPFVLLGCLWPLSLLIRRLRRGTLWWIWTALLCGTFALNLLLLSCVAYANDRYAVDFLPAGLLLALLGAVAAGEILARFAAARWMLRGVVVTLGLVTGAHFLLLAIDRHPDPTVRERVATTLNRPIAALEALASTPHGPQEIQLRLPDSFPLDRREPIVATAYGRDVLYIRYDSPDTIRFGQEHRGSPTRWGEPRPARPGERLTLRVDLGALYPPAQHPIFSDWPSVLVRALRRRVEVRIGDDVVLRADSDFYPSTPGLLRVGRIPPTIEVAAAQFSGRIEGLRPLGMPTPSEIAGPPIPNPVRLRVRFPNSPIVWTEPLISTGHPGAGDLLYVTYLGPGRMKFGHDHWGAGTVETEPVTFDPEREQLLEVAFGSLHPERPAGERFSDLLRLRLNGQMLISFPRPFHGSSPLEVSLAYNACGSSAASSSFTGPLLAVEGRAELPAPDDQELTGPLQLVLRFPQHRTGAREPILTTGIPGAGNAVYVAYLDDQHIQIGYDHWGIGALTSKPVHVDFAASHRLEISFASLLGKTSNGQERSPHVQILLNGRAVIDAPFGSHHVPPGTIVIGKNAIGVSTCEMQFHGEILSAERGADPSLSP
jgi:hypothetical protein